MQPSAAISFVTVVVLFVACTTASAAHTHASRSTLAGVMSAAERGGELVTRSRPYLQSTPALRALEGVMEDCIETGIGMRVSRKAKLYMMKRLVVGGKVRSAAGLLGRAAEYGCCDFESRAP